MRIGSELEGLLCKSEKFEVTPRLFALGDHHLDIAIGAGRGRSRRRGGFGFRRIGSKIQLRVVLRAQVFIRQQVVGLLDLLDLLGQRPLQGARLGPFLGMVEIANPAQVPLLDVTR